MNAAEATIRTEAQRLYDADRQAEFARRDQHFAWFFLAQWAVAVVIAFVWSPYAWEGRVRSPHIHVYYALFFGALLALPPQIFARRFRGHAATRHVMAVAQMGWSALLIHLTGGRIETHFHIFGSLAFLAFYRDWRVLVTATGAVVIDHLTRALLWPESVFASANPEWWRAGEHAMWVVFEVSVLLLAMMDSQRNAIALAVERATLASTSANIATIVAKRTHELQVARDLLAERAHAFEVARDKAEEASRAKTAFLANMSHEIRTPLNGVISMARFLEDTPLSAYQRDIVATLVQSGEGLLAIVNDVLDLAKIEAQKLTICSSPMKPAAVAREVAALFRAVAKSGDVTVGVDVADDLPENVLADPIRVRQIVTNLASNAIKFTHTGSVTIHVRRQAEHPDMLEFAVEDTGIGITEEALGRLFTSFEQADASTSRKYGGTGLGLAISRQLAQLMGGSLMARSVVGKGSTFTLALPCVAAEGVRPVVAAPAPRRERTREPNVLVVEDNIVNQRVAQLMLAKLGCHVELASDGAEAIARVQETRFDLILMDCHMPNVDGYEATRRIRDAERAADTHVAIIALTASAIDIEREKCLEAGMDDYLTKPVRAGALDEVISRYCDAA